ncbi:MAG: hypothetical protein IJJ61_04860 [Clostridia bacterium]|nr:hypothetical protein [Clostridia bacterium]
MKKTSKRIISLLLALVMVAGVVAIGLTVNAAGEEYAEDFGDDIQHAIMRESEGGSEQVGVEGHTYKEVDPGVFKCVYCNHELGTQANSPHEGYIVKKGNNPAGCEVAPTDVYRCRECGNEYTVITGIELGHYWPVVLDSSDNPVYAVDEDNNPILDGDGNPMLLLDDRYVDVSWNENDYESCSITIKCQRPGCTNTLSYTVYTMEDEIGKIERETRTTICQEVDTTYTAIFRIPNIPKGTFDYNLYFETSVDYTIPGTGHVEAAPVRENEVDATCIADGSYDNVIRCANCDKELSRETVIVPATGHIGGSPEIENEVAATCTENGSYDSVIYCTVCGEEISRNQGSVPKLGHEFDYEKDATGHIKYCTRCDYREEKADHVWENGECSVCHYNHDCNADGHIWGKAQPYDDDYHQIKCQACGETREIQHKIKPGYQTDAGYHWIECEDCGARIEAGPHKDEELNFSDSNGNLVTDGRCDVCEKELSHRWKKSGGTPATCTAPGENVYTCVNCGDEYKEPTVAEGHYWSDEKEFVDFEWNEDCTQCTLTLSCTHGCGETLKYTVYRTGNTGNIITAVPGETPATCTEEGHTDYKAVFTIQDVTSINGWHASTDTFETDDSKYVENGETQNGKITKPALGHDWNENSWTTTTNPTCTEDGEKSRTCERCHETETQSVPALGHDFASDYTPDDSGLTHSKKCSRCDATTGTADHTATRYTSNGNGTHSGRCTVCNANFTVECTEFDSVDNGDGTHSETCKECGYHSDAEAHTYEWQPSGDTLHKKVCKICGAIDPDNYGPHEADNFYTLDDNQHSAICKICNAEYKENHKLVSIASNATVEPTCTEPGKGDVTIMCEKCGYIKETKTDVEIPALGHDFDENGVCTRCGATRSCATEGHAVYEGAELQYDGIVHYYTCRYCGASVYPDSEGKLVNVTVTINSDGATEVSPNSARHAAQDYYLDDVNELHSFERCTKCAHIHNFVKMGTITGNCETYSYDTYKCTTCEQKVNVRKGDQLGHYWPIELEDDGLTPKVDEDGSVVFDEDYVSFRWGAKNESCTITLTCKRPDCGKTVSYTIYTKKTDFGMITKKKTCLGTKYIATFTNLPDIPTGSDGTYVLTTTASVETGSGSHTPGKVLEKVDPTCTEAGYTRYECKKCGEDFKVTTPATGHDYKMKTDATGKTWYECSKCGASYTLTPCRDGQHVDEDFDFVCERCHSKISFRENWPHYIVGLPMYWIRKAISWLFDGRQGILKF